MIMMMGGVDGRVVWVGFAAVLRDLQEKKSSEIPAIFDEHLNALSRSLSPLNCFALSR